MRVESSVTAISWIPSEAISGLPKLPFEVGIGHYDEPPPEMLAPGDLDALRDADRFREANELRAWIEVEDGRIVAQGYSGRGLVGATTFSLGPKKLVVPGVAFDVLQADPVVSDGSARFVQTVGGRAGFPAPRRVKQKPFVRINSATAWTTLALTINADGTSEHELVGASSFPRHWIYDRDGALSAQERHRRFRDVVPRGARGAHSLGRRGLRGVRHPGRDEARATALALADEGGARA